MMTTKRDVEFSCYRYEDNKTNNSHTYLLKPTIDALNNTYVQTKTQRRVFDLGCGNGSISAILSDLGYEVSGVDPSVEGIAHAQKSHPELRLELGSAYDDLVSKFGRWPAVISLEVVEHLYSPQLYAKTLYDLLEPGGTAIVSTPYHGYWKNLALALSGKMDKHFTALWEHGHIKFWSYKTLSTLLLDAGFEQPIFLRVGRIGPFAKSMIAITKKPTLPSKT